MILIVCCLVASSAASANELQNGLTRIKILIEDVSAVAATCGVNKEELRRAVSLPIYGYTKMRDHPERPSSGRTPVLPGLSVKLPTGGTLYT
jgi:hypothetical protein